MSNELTTIEIDSYQITRSEDNKKLATELADFIKKNGLSSSIQGKDFVNVEGWQYAGSRLGIVPITRWTKDLTENGPDGKSIIRFEARVELLDMRTQQIIGAGEAECDNTESGKKFYARFAVKSMAQTRAIGKAYRNLLAWIIRAAGYNPTPAEEFTSIADACLEALTATDQAELKTVWDVYNRDFGKAAAFKLAVNARKAQLAPAEVVPVNG